MNAFSERARARRYLLGRTTEQENADIETRYLADDDAVDQLRLVEDDLIEAYLDRRLAADELAGFEQAFMSAPRRRARVETVRLLRRAASPASQSPDETSSASSATSAAPRSSWRPWLALAASLLMILGIAGVWRTAQPTVVETADTSQADAATPAVSAAAPPSSTPASSVPATPAPRVFAVALSAMAVRGGGDTRPITVPPGTDRVQVNLELERATTAVAPTRAVLSTVGGTKRWQGPVVVTGDNAAVEIPASAVTPDDYLIALVAPDGAGGERTWMQYALQVR